MIFMANKGKSRHIKRLNAPTYFAVHKKEHVYAIKPNPGRHTLEKSVPLGMIVRRMEIAANASEARSVLKNGGVKVNGKVVQAVKYPLGLGDTLELVASKEYYRIGIDRLAKVSVERIEKPDYDSKLYKVTGKYKTKGNRLMLRLHDGTVIAGKADVKVNDSVVLDAKGGVSKVMALNKGAACEVIDGVHIGAEGKIASISAGTMHKQAYVTIEPKKGEGFETLVGNIMVTG